MWPPPDFYLEVEELRTVAPFQVTRRLQVWADGTVLYKKADEQLPLAAGGAALAVFSDVCAYQLLPEVTRLLARKLSRRGVLQLDDELGDHLGDEGTALRLRYHGFGKQKNVQASGQIHGTLVYVLRTINAYMPAGEEFTMPGMTGDKEPSTLRGVPSPWHDRRSALAFHQELLRRFSADRTLQLDAFALACRLGERAIAELLLQELKRGKVEDAGASPQKVAALPQFTDELLRPLLPPAPVPQSPSDGPGK